MKGLFFSIALLSIGIGHAQTWFEKTKLTASDASMDDWFGCSVAICEDIAVVGAFYDSDHGTASGSAYVYQKKDSVWVEVQKLTASDAAAGDNFGWSVSISDGIIVIGARKNDDNGSNSGAAYVFTTEHNHWSEKQKLIASDASAGDSFGHSVANWDNKIAIGANLDDHLSTNTGSVYIFDLVDNHWQESSKLIPSDSHLDDNFGCAVSGFGNKVIIGANQNDENGKNAGSAYIFELIDTHWIESAKINASDGATQDSFGFSVDISDSIAVVGSILDDDEGSGTGSVYLFTLRNGTWKEIEKLNASDPAAFDYFGSAISISENWIAIGAYRNDDVGNDTGSAYLFKKTGDQWEEHQKILASDAKTSDRFGNAVSISGHYVIIGAKHHGEVISESGSAYLFEITPN
jgi:hypothetical protein